MKVAVASSSRLALPTFDTLLASGHSIVGSISNPDAPSGRGKKISPNEFSLAMLSRGVPLEKPENHHQLHEVLLRWRPEIVIVIAYGRLIKMTELSIPHHGWINLHFSLLPQYRGAAPVQRALHAGERKTGVTVFRLDEGMDTGPMYCQKEVAIHDGENAGALLDRLAIVGSQAIIEALAMIKEGRSPHAQPSTGISMAPKIERSELRIDWRRSAFEIDNQVRAFSPSPGAWTTIDGLRVIIHSVRQRDGLDLKPGEIDSENGLLLVGTGNGALEIRQITPAGRREMSAGEWLRGARLSHQNRFE